MAHTFCSNTKSTVADCDKFCPWHHQPVLTEVVSVDHQCNSTWQVYCGGVIQIMEDADGQTELGPAASAHRVE